MSIQQSGMTHSMNSTNLADLLERVLDKGLVIVGDIKIKLVDVELLSIQLRLLICSVDKAREIGVDWWSDNAAMNPAQGGASLENTLSDLRDRLAALEAASTPPALPAATVPQAGRSDY